MINLPVDEAYAFDYLAILAIKSDFNTKNIQAYTICEESIKKQIGHKLFNIIITSIEYKNMLETNKKVFDSVQQARYGSISAKEVDDCNMQRFYAKKAIQEKFFPNIVQTETKT